MGIIGRLRGPARAWCFRTLRQLLLTEDGKRIVADSLRGLTTQPPLAKLEHSPYRDRDIASPPGTRRPVPVFITARFRTGSTLLWKIFRQVPHCTAYYEPLNERRWFDQDVRGYHVDPSHGVDDYWHEYEGLAHLAQMYREEWTSRSLYMAADACDPALEAYLGALIEAAPRRAVLQFNRVDFRLPWLRRTFPDAVIIHLYRHPRDQWVSTLWGRDFPRTGSVEDFEQQDSFYLVSWARDLCYHFPFLDPRAAKHPYELFYYLWRLSFAFGRQYATASFCYETLCEAPREEVARLLAVTHSTTAGIDALAAIVDKPVSAQRPRYADDKWFAAIEARCDERLQRVAARADEPPVEQTQSREVA